MTLKRNDQSWSKDKKTCPSLILFAMAFFSLFNSRVCRSIWCFSFCSSSRTFSLLWSFACTPSGYTSGDCMADSKRPVENSADSNIVHQQKSFYVLPSVEKIFPPWDSHLAFAACFSFSHFFLSFSKEVIRRWALANWFLNVTFSITGHTAWWVALSLKGPCQPQPDSKYLQRTLRLVGLRHHSSNHVQNPNPAPSVLICKETHAEAMQSHISLEFSNVHASLVFRTRITVKLHPLIVSYMLHEELPSSLTPTEG